MCSDNHMPTKYNLALFHIAIFIWNHRIGKISPHKIVRDCIYCGLCAHACKIINDNLRHACIQVHTRCNVHIIAHDNVPTQDTEIINSNIISNVDICFRID